MFTETISTDKYLYDSSAVSERLTARRKSTNTTQEALAFDLKISPSYYGAIERGDSMMPLNVALNLARHYHTGLDDLVLGHSIISSEDIQTIRNACEVLAALLMYFEEHYT